MRFWFQRGPREVLIGLLVWVMIVVGHAWAREWARVKWVDDGDSVMLEDGRRVRYIGIDAPEMGRNQTRPQPFSRESRQLNLDLVAGQKLRLEYDKGRQDRYHRLLAYVYLPDDTFVNRHLVELGLAHCLPTRPNNRHEKTLLEAQRKAMTARVGLWATGPDTVSQSIVGHRKSKRFHYPDCPYAHRIAFRNRVIFNSRWDAFWAGFAPSKGCQNKNPLHHTE